MPPLSAFFQPADATPKSPDADGFLQRWLLTGVSYMIPFVAGGGLLIALGFLLRFNPMLVIAASALVTGLAAGIDPLAILAAWKQLRSHNGPMTIDENHGEAVTAPSLQR